MKLLEPEAIPMQFHYRRSHPLTSKGWAEVRKKELARTGGKCEYCGNSGRIIHHEYEYKTDSVENTIQRIVVGFAVSCYRCNEVLHFVSFASNTARGERAIEHFMRVRGFTELEARNMVLLKVNKWAELCRMTPVYGEADRYKLCSDGIYMDMQTGIEIR